MCIRPGLSSVPKLLVASQLAQSKSQTPYSSLQGLSDVSCLPSMTLTPSSIIFPAHAPGHAQPLLCLEFVMCASLKTSALVMLAAQRACPPDACTRSCLRSFRCLLNVTFSEKPCLATLFKMANSRHAFYPSPSFVIIFL